MPEAQLIRSEPPELGGRIGKYELSDQLGEDAGGYLFRGFDPYMDRDVAIKISRFQQPTGSQLDNAERQFFIEAQAAGALSHPNIVEVYDAGCDDGRCYIVMEYLAGCQTLKRFTKPDQLLNIGVATELLSQCALALDYSHKRGVVHRDIKPANLLLTRGGTLKVSNFAAALFGSADPARPTTDGFAGSPLYMSPEQTRREPLNGQTDLFSLGVVAYQLLAGRHPFAAANIDAIEHMITRVNPLPIAEFRAGLPDIYQRILDKALAKQREHRYQSGVDFAGDLAIVHEFIDDGTAQPRPKEKFAQLESLEFFAGFSHNELWEIVHAAEWLTVPAGDLIVVEGDEEPAFFVTISGDLAVKKGPLTIVGLGPGDCFGEMALERERPRSATICAESEATVIKLRNSIIERASVNCQLTFQKKFLYTLIDRLDRATEMIADAARRYGT